MNGWTDTHTPYGSSFASCQKTYLDTPPANRPGPAQASRREAAWRVSSSCSPGRDMAPAVPSSELALLPQPHSLARHLQAAQDPNSSDWGLSSPAFHPISTSDLHWCDPLPHWRAPSMYHQAPNSTHRASLGLQQKGGGINAILCMSTQPRQVAGAPPETISPASTGEHQRNSLPVLGVGSVNLGTTNPNLVSNRMSLASSCSSQQTLFSNFLYQSCCSVTKVCPTLHDPMDYSMPGFPVLHHLPELAQTHVHGVDVD